MMMREPDATLAWSGFEKCGLKGLGTEPSRVSGELPRLRWICAAGTRLGVAGQRDIRQHMTAPLPGIIMPAVPGASEEVRGCALVVMSVSQADCDAMCQFHDDG